jgi:hypothetical protein
MNQLWRHAFVCLVQRDPYADIGYEGPVLIHDFGVELGPESFLITSYDEGSRDLIQPTIVPWHRIDHVSFR